MFTSDEILSAKQEAAIIALISNRTVEEAARQVRVTPKTIYRWLKEPKFREVYRETRSLSFSQTVARLQQMSNAAATTIGKVMIDPATPPATKVRAADSILTHGRKATEVEDLEARLSELEKVIDDTKPGWRKK